jgi:hypothetical protein
MRDYMKRHAKECQTTGKPIDARVVFAQRRLKNRLLNALPMNP